ncbi:type II secretion system protein GspD [Deinococcus antarcticus]|uniref:Type II secretion system protein GspD n=1 Tax=Deinococcus antarcticus TaxID=1298767 RepID=A0ABV8A108_9DEIO
MNKRHVLLLTAVLGMASPFALAQADAQNAASIVRNATKDPNLTNALITMNIGGYVGPLSTLLAGLAKSAGYEIVFDFNPDALPLINGDIVLGGASSAITSINQTGKGTTTPSNTFIPYATPTGKPTELNAKPVVYNFINKPFNEVWPLLAEIHDLRYEVIKLGTGSIIKVSQKPKQLAIGLTYITAQEALDKAEKFFGVARYRDITSVEGGVSVTNRVFEGYRLPDDVKILADATNNRLIIGATNEFASRIDSFISTIDIPAPVKPATPAAIATQQVIYKVAGSVDTALKVLSDQFPNLKVTPVGNTSQLILTGEPNILTSARELLSKIDVAAEKPATASEAQVQRVYRVRGIQKEAQDFLTAQFPTLRVTPVGTTGQLVLNGPVSTVTAALELLGEVDRTPAVATNASVQRVFQLVNASAEEVKATLEGTLQKEVTTTALRGTGTTLLDVNGNPISALVPPSQQASADAQGLKTTDLSGTTPTTAPDMPNIIADKRTNTIIVRGTPLQVDQVAELIPQLDKVVPQINVQVRIQELTDSATRSLGLNANLNFGGFSIGTSSGNGLAATFDPTKTLMGFNIFPTLTALETQNLARRVYDGNVTMQSGQRALGGTSQTENASSTAAASVKSGGSLEINIPSQAANIPSIQKTIDYGVILDFFSPQVAPDGTITVRVRGKVNTPPTNITANNIPYVLNFQNSEAQSLVSFKSGETLLLAGLMGNTAANGSTGIPYLSKFGIGGTTTKDSKFSQLLVIITGTIVK